MAKLLLIDDEGVLRDALKTVLVQKGHEVSVAANGPEGLALIKREIPDLIVLDKGLPGMTGSEVLREIRKLSREVRVIVLTGYLDAESEREYHALGISEFLSKTISLDSLLKVIGRELANMMIGVPASTPPPAAKILVVDDDPNIQSVLRTFLQSKGFQIESAFNGQEALGILERFHPQLVLMDIHMPVMNGIETLQRIKQSSHQTAVMMISANKDKESMRRCMELGACDFFLKPFNLEYLHLSVWTKIVVALI